MNVIGLTKTSHVNGRGERAILWVAGCSHHCKGCQNPETWDPAAGVPYTTAIQEKLFYLASKRYRDGITLSGGDPMFPRNRKAILSLCRSFRHRFGNTKNIWMYTGYRLEEIKDDPILEYIDVLVDGEYVEELRSEYYPWAGSTNQRVLQRTKDGWRTYHEV